MPSVDSRNEVRLRPLSDEFQRCNNFRLATSPNATISSYEEPGGRVDTFVVPTAHSELSILAEAEVETLLHDPFANVDLLTYDWAFYRSEATKSRYAEFLHHSHYTQPHPGVGELTNTALALNHGSVAQFLINLNGTIHDSFRYVPGATDVHSTLGEVLDLGAGVCQDFAHLMLACCRMAEIPARYVSGYLFCGGDPALRGNQATHAWIECPLPNGKWFSLDPTNDLLANDRYVRVHVGRDYADVTPTRGVYLGAPGAGLTVTVDVELLTPARQRSG